MTFDNLRQDLRLAVGSLLRAPAFAAVTILTLALGIGANTAIFSIVNGVILRLLGYPKPEQLMYLTTQFAAQGFDQFWVSPPEYFEFREINQSFAAVGAYSTGEINLNAGDRPMRVRSASVDDTLMAERRREIGIRMALGADQSSVLGQVMKQGLVLTTIGIVVGLVGAFALNRLIASLLFGVQPTDTTTIVAVVATITLVATVACLLPAWRASRVDPNVVLRDD